MFDDAPQGLGYLVPADTDGCNGIVIIEAEFFQGVIGLFHKINFSENPVEMFVQNLFKSHKIPQKLRFRLTTFRS